MWIDLNVDAGESFGNWKLGLDEALFPLVSSVNVACGFHAGDPLTMRRTLELAQRAGIAVGAHPGFPDLVGFGRREMAATPEEVYADVLYQVGALAAFLRVAGMPLHHVKPHGALYNRATRDAPTAAAIARAVRDYDPGLPLVVLPGTPLEVEAQRLGLRTVAEAFPERGYTQDGRLAPRGTPGAWIHDPELAARRAVQMVLRGQVETVDGGVVPVRAQTLCIHGDNPQALAIAKAVREALEREGVVVRTY
ncbi:MAG: LamB/YcsF family protein [Meiothermus sp.]|uniref:LamB/YcsF family protein n=1 Tax=Meiothermus sp. TaxID=1955249 RepID=UPI0025FE9E62|nr:5-oxoprolinase subunit PxpA [Meiothermus sp.]MCS7058330.1 LamB/YcsF family protein [Meiothermus sp.]MCS7194291.1 LamB/YcsF family protein [Meiothermus sp.]MCX7741257.1 LamB/YcsF family protein [Meiothermus sp.]